MLKRSLKKSNYSKGIFYSVYLSLKAAFSNEIENAAIDILINNQKIPVVSDGEGYVEWSTNDVSLLKHMQKSDDIYISYSDSVQQLPLSKYAGELKEGVISDIDDTVLMTNVKSLFKLRMIFNSIFLNPLRRRPIDKASELYTKLRGDIGVDMPFIYLSNSPWNMFYYIRSFLDHYKFPQGILLLRDFGLQMLQKKKPLEQQNKYLLAEKMLNIFPNTTFTLLGDSAEHDFDIYTKLLHSYPARISRIIIRKASNRNNEKYIQELLSSDNNSIVQLVSTYCEVVL